MGFVVSSSISVEKNGLDVVIKKVVLDVVVLNFVRCGRSKICEMWSVLNALDMVGSKCKFCQMW